MPNVSQLAQAVLKLPLDERVRLAQELWASFQPAAAGNPVAETNDAFMAAEQRDAELDAGRVTGISHEQVMETARKSLRCE